MTAPLGLMVLSQTVVPLTAGADACM